MRLTTGEREGQQRPKGPIVKTATIRIAKLAVPIFRKGAQAVRMTIVGHGGQRDGASRRRRDGNDSRIAKICWEDASREKATICRSRAVSLTKATGRPNFTT